MQEQRKKSRVLVAMVSADPIVMAKLVGTLQPRALLLLETAHSKEKGWAQHLTPGLRACWPNLTVCGPEQIEGEDATRFAASVRAAWSSHRASLPEELDELLVDTTTGMGLLRFLLVEIVRDLPGALSIPSALVYCDSEQGVVRRLSRGSSGWTEDDLQINIHLEGDPLRMRSLLYGFSGSDIQASKVWPCTLQAPLQKHSTLAESTLNHQSLRVLFASYPLIESHWNRVLNCKRDVRLAPQRFKSLLASSTSSLDKALAASVRDAINVWLGGGGEGGQYWDALVLRSKRAGEELKVRIKKAVTKFTQKIPGTRLDADAITENIARHWSGFVGAVEKPAPTLPKSRGSAVQDYLAKHNLSVLASHLPRNTSELSDAFEDIVSWHAVDGVAKTAESPEIASIVAVYRKVKVFRNGIQLTEIDTLIIYRSGDLAVIEAKAHYASAKAKDIDARIKNWRDHLGAKTRACLVFPWTSKDLAAIDERQPIVPDVADWKNYKSQAKLNIQGLDQIKNWIQQPRREVREHAT
jgi:hypothetical protein